MDIEVYSEVDGEVYSEVDGEAVLSFISGSRRPSQSLDKVVSSKEQWNLLIFGYMASKILN